MVDQGGVGRRHLSARPTSCRSLRTFCRSTSFSWSISPARSRCVVPWPTARLSPATRSRRRRLLSSPGRCWHSSRRSCRCELLPHANIDTRIPMCVSWHGLAFEERGRLRPVPSKKEAGYALKLADTKKTTDRSLPTSLVFLSVITCSRCRHLFFVVSSAWVCGERLRAGRAVRQ